jgi:RND family efflux transporter MFP subunit
MQSIQVKIAKASLISPISGVITVQNAKTGQIASPGAIMTSIITSNNLEIDAFVPETDIGKISNTNPVDITFDAFPGETFTGKVFYIDPAQTLQSGVVDYKIKVALDKNDSRIKSGLTANLIVKTRTDKNALILPQFAILQNDQGTYIETLENGAMKQIPVTLGIHDDQGNVEIVSGVTQGEQVINIGLK